MNIKALALSSALALGSIFGTVGAAEARPSQCWVFGNSSSVAAESCDVTLKRDSQGEPFWSINNGEAQFILYDDGTAQVFRYGKPANDGANWFAWSYDSDGDIRIKNARTGQSIFAFRK